MARVLYKITNLINGKCYIGQTNNFKSRMRAHRNINAKKLALISKTIKKYGVENFSFHKLAIVEDYMADDAEQKAIKTFNSMVPNGYNLCSGGCLNKQYSKESKEKISRARIGMKITEEAKRKMSLAKIGKPSPRKGIPHSEETKRKLSEKNKGSIPPNKGKKMSEEFCRNTSLGHMGQKSWNKGQRTKDSSLNKMSKTKQSKSLNPSGVMGIYYDKARDRWTIRHGKRFIKRSPSLENAKEIQKIYLKTLENLTTYYNKSFNGSGAIKTINGVYIDTLNGQN